MPGGNGGYLPPSSAAAARIVALEQGQQQIRDDQTAIRSRVDTNSDTLMRLETHLTGEGVKGSKGVLGEINDTLVEIASSVRKLNDKFEDDKETRKKEIADEVALQLSQAVVVRSAGLWQRQTAAVKWFAGIVITAATGGFFTLIVYVILDLAKLH